MTPDEREQHMRRMLAHGEKVRAAQAQTENGDSTMNAAEQWTDHGEPPPEETPVILASSKNAYSMTIGKIAAAMAKAQGAMKGAVKDSANPFFKSKYADLASVWDDCRKPLSDNEIAVFQLPSSVGKRVSVVTLLAHPSNEWIRNELEMDSKDGSPQGIGSAITYARRYALSAMVGAYAVDDDGEAAHGRQNAPQQDDDRQGFQERAESLAKRFREVHKAGIDGAMLELHESANKDQDVYSAAWGLLSAPVRARIKLGIENARKAAAGAAA